MNRDLLTPEALFVGQLLGTVVLVVGLFVGGISSPLVLGGGAIIALSIAGLAATAFETEARVQPGGEPVRRDGDDNRLPLSHGSK